MIIENFYLDVNFIYDNHYTICFNTIDYNKGKGFFDFMFIKNLKDLNGRYYELLQKYNVIQKCSNGYLFSNKYMIINNHIYEIEKPKQIEHTKIFIKSLNVVIRFFNNKNVIKNILQYKDDLKKYLPNIIYISQNIIVEQKIEYNKIIDCVLLPYKFIFYLYIIIFKNIKLYDLSPENIIIDRNFHIYIIDIDKRKKLSIGILIINAILIYTVFLFIDNEMVEKIQNKLFANCLND